VNEAAEFRVSVTDTSSWTPVGGQIGSNPGGSYQAPDGVRWYLKTPSSNDHVRNELLANRLYRLAGAEVPDLALVIHDGRLAVASRVVKGLTLADLVGTTAEKARAAVCDHFAADAWLANRDVLGADLDNVLVCGGGLVMRIDQGGALRFRAQGSLKTDFGPEAIEFETLRDPKRNAVAASVFGAMDREQLLASLQRVVAIEDGTIRDTVLGVCGASAEAESLAELLIARRDDLARRATALATD
jgi:hypothetical protein